MPHARNSLSSLFLSAGLCLTALASVHCAADAELDSSFGTSDKTDVQPWDDNYLAPKTGACDPDTLAVTGINESGQPVEYCIHPNYCQERVGDFCGSAPIGLATSTTTEIWSDALFWCYDTGTLVNEGGQLRIQKMDGSISELPKRRLANGQDGEWPLLRTDADGCLSNEVGHGLRDGTCAAEQDQEIAAADPATELLSFDTCSAPGPLVGLHSAISCAKTTIYDHRDGTENYRFEARTRSYCEGACSQDACVAPPVSITPLPGQPCDLGYSPVSIDGSSETICILDAACHGASDTYFDPHCIDAPAKVQKLADWVGADGNPVGGGLPIKAGALYYSCGEAAPGVWKAVSATTCPALLGVEGQCIINENASACLDQSAEALKIEVASGGQEMMCSKRFAGYRNQVVNAHYYVASTGEKTSELGVLSTSYNAGVCTYSECRSSMAAANLADEGQALCSDLF